MYGRDMIFIFSFSSSYILYFEPGHDSYDILTFLTILSLVILIKKILIKRKECSLTDGRDRVLLTRNAKKV